MSFLPAATAAEAQDVSGETYAVGHASGGDTFILSDGKWRYNLATKNYEMPGTYTVTMVSGDESEYVLNPTCSVELAR